MKKMKRFAITSLVICIGFLNAFAAAGNSFSVTTDENNFIVLNFGEVSTETIEVDIQDANGNNVFNEKISGQKIKRRKYDLKYLETGDYLIIVNFATTIKMQQIKKTYKKLKIVTANKTTFLKPFIKSKAGKVDVNMLCFHGNFIIQILDLEANIVYEEIHEANGSFHTRYNLKTLPAGKYSFNIKINTKNFKGSFAESVIIFDDMSTDLVVK